EQIVAWLETAFDGPPPESDDMGWDPEPRHAVIDDAIATDHDGYLEFLGTGLDAQGRPGAMYHRLRLRPERVEERVLDAASLGLHGAPDASFIELPERGWVVEGQRVPDGAVIV